jgi:hypothetical protein
MKMEAMPPLALWSGASQIDEPIGKAEPFRTSDGRAVGKQPQPERVRVILVSGKLKTRTRIPGRMRWFGFFKPLMAQKVNR